ncbi:MAG: response regulator [Bacteroidota bacterium]
MKSNPLHLLLADDDEDDCMFFREALNELAVSSSLQTVANGVQLMQLLTSELHLPDVVFMDLNMPRKAGYDCLVEIKANEKLKKIPIIIYSTSYDHDVVKLLYQLGAQHYVRKPGEFTKLKKIILEAITTTIKENRQKPLLENFVIEI